jgi:hypothetical protein
MNLTLQERTIVDFFRLKGFPEGRFQPIPAANLKPEERDVATRSLVEKGILAPLADGEYWLTDQGARLLGLA